MTWDKPITADGCTATPEQMQAAWDRWLQGVTMATDLALLLEAEGIPRSVPAKSPFRMYASPSSRVADRMLQRARKAGAIRYVKGCWEIVPQPNPAA